MLKIARIEFCLVLYKIVEKGLKFSVNFTVFSGLSYGWCSNFTCWF